MASNKNDIIDNACGPVKIQMTNDYLFKALLQKNKRVLKALICSLLHYDPHKIRDLRIVNPIILGEAVGNKDIILDVNVTFNNGAHLDLEMQVIDEGNWVERSLYYTCRNFTSLIKGSMYENAKASIQIGLLNYTLFEDHPSFYNTFDLRDKDGNVYTDKFSIGVVDLTNINLATDEDKRYNIDKWAMLFKAKTWEEIKMLAKQDSSIKDAATTINELSEDERIQQQCEARALYMYEQRKRQHQMRELKKELKQAQVQLTQKSIQIEQQAEQIEHLNTMLSKLSDEIARLKASNGEEQDI